MTHAVTKHEKTTVNIIYVSEVCSSTFAGGGYSGIVTGTAKQKNNHHISRPIRGTVIFRYKF